jgi:E3 ubiquitin-protein ligase RNF5
MEGVKRPVATHCGHVFCWGCLRGWLDSGQAYLTCPVCRNGITRDTVISLYLRDEEDEQDAGAPRPQPNRMRVPNNPSAMSRNISTQYRTNLHEGRVMAGYGLFPSIANLLFQVDNIIEDDGSPEAKYQCRLKVGFAIMLSALLLMVIYI